MFLQMPASMGNFIEYFFADMVLLFRICNTNFSLQSSAAPENCRFARWVDPAPIHPHQEYIYYLQNHIFDLEMAVSTGDVEDNINSDDTDS